MDTVHNAALGRCLWLFFLVLWLVRQDLDSGIRELVTEHDHRPHPGYSHS